MRIPRIAAVAGAFAGVLALLLTGCAPGPASDEPGIITVNGSEPKNPLVPANTVEVGGNRILDAIFAGLVFYDESGSAVDDLAESITSNDKNTVYTVSVVDDSTFTDGEDVTADSFVDAWDWAARAENGTLNRQYFSDILGYSDDEDVSLIEAGGLVVLDNHTFEIHLKSSLSDFAQRLGHVAFLPLPSVFFDDPVTFGTDPIGNGPYMFDGADAWQHNKRLKLVANPGYGGEREPENDGLRMIFYESLDVAYTDLLAGTLDVLDTVPDSAHATFKEELGARWIDQSVTALESLTIPAGLAHLSGPEGALRRAALSQAIDRAAIANEVFGVTRIPAADFATPSITGFVRDLPGSEVLRFNDDGAKQKWAKADLLSPWEGTFEIAYNADGGHGPWVDAVAASIHEVLGIDVVGVPYPTFAELKTAIDEGTAASAYRNAWRADYPGVANFLVPLYGAKAAENSGKYSSKAFEEQLKLASLATSPEEATKVYKKAQQILLIDLPALPLWNQNVQAGFGAGVDDVELDWRGVPLYYLITRSDG